MEAFDKMQERQKSEGPPSSFATWTLGGGELVERGVDEHRNNFCADAFAEEYDSGKRHAIIIIT